MTVHHRIFESSSKSWEQMCSEAEAFASSVGKQNLIEHLPGRLRRHRCVRARRQGADHRVVLGVT